MTPELGEPVRQETELTNRPRRRVPGSPPGPGPRWVHYARFFAIVAAGTLVVATLSLSIQWIRDHARDTVNADPIHTFRFDDIVLDTPPPAWIKPGREGFLEDVRVRARRPRVQSLAATDLEALREDFKSSPWVSEVRKLIAEYPNRVTVQIDYREPVAIVKVDGRPIYLDGEGFVLPGAEIAIDHAGALITIHGPQRPGSLRPGIRWGLGKLPYDDSEPDRKVQAAAGLAAFLKSRGANSSSHPLPPALHVVAIHSQDRRGLFVQLANQVMILWGEEPGSRRSGRPSADEKWEILRDWVENRGPAALNTMAGDYAEFSTKTVVIHRQIGSRN